MTTTIHIHCPDHGYRYTNFSGQGSKLEELFLRKVVLPNHRECQTITIETEIA